MRKIVAIVMLLLLCFADKASAVGRNGMMLDVSVRNITMNDGLPTNAVRSIVQDKFGFVWFGTDNGLCRYDGYGVQTFTIAQNKFDQYVSALCINDDNLLVGTPYGPYVFSCRTEQFAKLTDEISVTVNDFAMDGDGNVWVSTKGKGVYRYNLRSHECRNYPFAQWGGMVSKAFIDGNNQVWALSNNVGTVPYRLNKSTNKFERVAVKSGMRDLGGLTMTQGNDGSLLIGTWDNGLVQLNADGTTEQLINPMVSNIGHRIHVLYRNSATEILVGCDDGLLCYDLQTKEWRVVSRLCEPELSISERFVYDVSKDREGGLWMGTFYGGVTYFSPIGERFQKYMNNEGPNALHGNVVGRFCEDGSRRIWIATDDGGLNCYDAVNGRFVTFPGQQAMAKYNVHGLCVDGNKLWVGTYGNGIICMDLATGSTKSYRLEANQLSSSCYCLFRDSQHRLWASSMDGTFLFDEQTGSFKLAKSFRSLTIDIKEDSHGNIWFATQGEGLWRYTAKGGKWKQYLMTEGDTTSVTSNQINCVQASAQGRLYVATDQGICEYLPATDNFRRIALTAPSKDVNCIVVYQDELWLSSSKGIIRYIPGERIQVYNRFDGLTCDQFQPNAGLLASDGRIYFGTTRGFNAFYPYQIKVNQVPPPVFITSLELFNKHVEVGSYKLPEALSQIAELNLSYDDNVFSISFAALSYISPEKNQYAYMLEGFDKDWIYSGSDHKATYTNIPAGSYVFRVKASNNDGVWSTQEAQLKIVVHPPFWWSLPAKLFYLLLLGSLIYLYTQLRVRKEKRSHQQELKALSEKKEQEIRDARLSFFTMIAHEIRTPVSLIIGPLENLKTEWKRMSLHAKNAATMDATIDVIDRNAQRLLNLVNQLLDFNKVQQHGMQVHFKLQNISKLMHAVAERFEPTLTKNGARLEVEYPADDFAAIVDSEAITKVISNLMTNATKYTKDYVKLSCEVVNKEWFRIKVADNGDGVKPEEQKKIFSAFYQAKDNKPGTGIGLSIVSNLVKAHHGKVEVESEEGKGATFIVTLPIHQQDAVVGEEDTVGVKAQVVDAENLEQQPETPQVQKLEKAEKTSKLPVMLVVEDDEDMRNFIATNFAETYRVLTAENGVEGLKQLAHHMVTLVVSDWMMPEMDGAEFCRQMRKNPDTSHIPFIMLTAKTDDTSKTEGMNCGADAYIEKPFSMKYLEACIRNMIEMRHLLQNKYSHTPLEPITRVASTPVDNELLVKMNKLIEENIDNPDLSVVFLAEKLNISRSTLFSKIKALVDVTPNEMIQLVKLKKAAQLLKEKRRVSEVCYMVGFSSPSYFSKCFQKQFGMKPAEFAEQS